MAQRSENARRSWWVATILSVWLVVPDQAWPLSNSLRERALADLGAAIEGVRATAVAGGYAGIIDLRDGSRYGESRIQPLSPTTIWIQPPGTPSVGKCYLRAFRVTGNRAYLDDATATGAALAASQLRNGGWDYVADLGVPGRTADAPRPQRRDGRATLDDDTSQGALDYLIDLDRDLDLDWLDRAVKDGLDFLLRAQHASGGWPQAFPASGNYKDLDTFNDGAIDNTIALLLRAFDIYGDPRYRDAALRGGEFILKRQAAPPQAGWGQQYDTEGRLAGARSFEPAALSAESTGTAARTLLELYLRTGDERYVAAVDRAIAWLDRIKIGPDLWPRYSEIGTDRPLYTDRNGQRYASPDALPDNVKSYRWQGPFVIPRLVREREELKRLGLERYRAEKEAQRRREPASRARAAETRLPQILSEFEVRKAWVDGEELRSGRFVRNCNTILDYVEQER